MKVLEKNGVVYYIEGLSVYACARSGGKPTKFAKCATESEAEQILEEISRQ